MIAFRVRNTPTKVTPKICLYQTPPTCYNNKFLNNYKYATANNFDISWLVFSTVTCSYLSFIKAWKVLKCAVKCGTLKSFVPVFGMAACGQKVSLMIKFSFLICGSFCIEMNTIVLIIPIACSPRIRIYLITRIKHFDLTLKCWN